MKLDYLTTAGTCEICGKRRSKGDHTKCSQIRKAQNNLKLPTEGTRLCLGKATAANYKLGRFKTPE